MNEKEAVKAKEQLEQYEQARLKGITAVQLGRLLSSMDDRKVVCTVSAFDRTYGIFNDELPYGLKQAKKVDLFNVSVDADSVTLELVNPTKLVDAMAELEKEEDGEEEEV